MQYLNKLLSIYTDEKITTVEQAMNIAPKEKEKEKITKKFNSEREYSKNELNSLFDSLEEIEI